MPLQAVPFRAHDHLLDGELGFALGIVDADREFVLGVTEVDGFGERDQLRG